MGPRRETIRMCKMFNSEFLLSSSPIKSEAEPVADTNLLQTMTDTNLLQAMTDTNLLQAMTDTNLLQAMTDTNLLQAMTDTDTPVMSCLHVKILFFLFEVYFLL